MQYCGTLKRYFFFINNAYFKMKSEQFIFSFLKYCAYDRKIYFQDTF